MLPERRSRRFILLTDIGFMKPRIISGNDSTSATTFSLTASDPHRSSPLCLPLVRFSATLLRRSEKILRHPLPNETRYILRQIYRNTDKEIFLRENDGERCRDGEWKVGARKTRGESFSRYRRKFPLIDRYMKRELIFYVQ